MLKKIISSFCFLLFASVSSYAFDWGGASEPIQAIFVYPNYVVVAQSTNYAGTAGCANNPHWSFFWGDLDPQTQQRVYSALLAAKHSKTPFKPIFADSGCGPEGHKKFTGYFVI